MIHTPRWLLLFSAVQLACARAPEPSPRTVVTEAPSASTNEHEPSLAAPPRRTDKEIEIGLILVIDRSGSMSGPLMETTKESSVAALAALSKNTPFAMILFDSQARVLVPLGPADRSEVPDLIRSATPGGGTNIAAGLEKARELIANANGHFGVLLLSDGQSPSDGLADLARDIHARGSVLSTIALGQSADRALLQRLAADGGGRFHEVDVVDGLNSVFLEEAREITR